MSAASSLPRTPVLVVDDERDVRELVTFALERAGYEVVAANDGVDALDKISGGFEPLVIVLDLEMPRLDGEGLIRELAERAAPVPQGSRSTDPLSFS